MNEILELLFAAFILGLIAFGFWSIVNFWLAMQKRSELQYQKTLELAQKFIDYPEKIKRGV